VTLEQTIRRIREILQKDSRGLTIQEMSRLAKVSRITAARALAYLEGAGLVEVRVVGNCRLHYWTGGGLR
jgi:response regulator of citrate/malate metabolism